MNAPLVCATGPPGNGKGAVQAPLPKLNSLNLSLTNTVLRAPLQLSGIWRGWEREAIRLFRGFWSTGNPSHLVAFCNHVAAMRAAHAGRRK
jgi:hypothetical protein